jgi:exopolysaccharide biosynthesis polyprenyl glycosylphosphotransferase
MTTESTGALGAGTDVPVTTGVETTAPRPASVPRPTGARTRHRPGLRRLALLGADGTATLTAASVGGGQWAALALLPAVASLLYLHTRCGLYRRGPLTTALDEFPRILGCAVLAWCVATSAVALTPAGVIGPWPLLATLLAQVAAGCAARAAVHALHRRSSRRRPRSALVVGAGTTGRGVIAALHERLEYGMHPVGLVHAGAGPLPATVPVPVLTSREDILRAVIQNDVRDAVFTRGPWGDPPTAALLPLFAGLGCTVWVIDPGLGTARRPAAGDHLWGFGCVRLDPAPRRLSAGPAKRALDLALTVPALLALLPLLAACAVAVRLSDGPGVLFRQERIGQDGVPFTVLKFRTLVPRDDQESATRWNVAHDGRMSLVGRILRRTSLDELPQLWNVVRGDMSLVGPRPERPHFVQQFSKTHAGYSDRHRMPAGITGLAQVHGLRGDTSIEDRARFDNHYIETWSLWQDVRILLRTVVSVFRLGGS